tara:strand:- start:1287 stop:1928 length:642 start_codon:yes stop_codon:yes gene_type:complete
VLSLLLNGNIVLFSLILVSLIISLTFHEFGHAATAKIFGDPTAEKMGRLSLNPLVHIDLMGLLMIIMIGFGYAKPVPTDPRNFNSKWADLFVSAAGPGMNLVLAIFAINFYYIGVKMGVGWMELESTKFFFIYFSLINLLLMLFNLIPIGALDGHYILPYFLPEKLAYQYRLYNHKYGNQFFLALILLSILGVPIFQKVWEMGQAMLPWIIFV